MGLETTIAYKVHLFECKPLLLQIPLRVIEAIVSCNFTFFVECAYIVLCIFVSYLLQLAFQVFPKIKNDLHLKSFISLILFGKPSH